MFLKEAVQTLALLLSKIDLLLESIINDKWCLGPESIHAGTFKLQSQHVTAELPKQF